MFFERKWESGKNRRLLSVLLSVVMVISMCVPAMGTELTDNQSEAEICGEVGGNIALISPTNASVSNNVWSLLSYSGRQTVPLQAKDGKFYTVKGSKFFAGKGATSSDAKVLKINGKGIAKVGKNGTASITSETYGNTEISVINPSISDKKLVLSVGESKQLSVSDVPEGIPVAWMSSNQNVIQVLSGNCIAVGIGKSKVSAIVGGKSLKCNITVKDKKDTTLIYNIGSKPVPVKGIKGIKKLKIDVSDNSVTVNKGKLVSSGAAKNPVSGNISDGHKLRIYSNSTDFEKSVELKIGERKCILPENTHEIPDFKSKNPVIASMSEFGVVIGQSAGNTVLSGKYGGKKIKINVKVTDEIYDGFKAVSGKSHALQIIDPVNGNDGFSAEISDNGSVIIKKDTAKKSVSDNKSEDDPQNESEEKLPDFPEKYDNNDEADPPEGYRTIVVDAGGGQIEIKHIYVKDGDTFPFFNTVPVREGFDFDYWEVDGKPLTKETIITKDSVIIARWKDKSGMSEYPSNTDNNENPVPQSGYATITVDPVDGEFPIRHIYVKQGDKLEKFCAEPVKARFKFTGWKKDGAAYDFNAPVNSDFILYAAYEYVGNGSKEKEDTPVEPELEEIQEEPDVTYYTVKFDVADGRGIFRDRRVPEGGSITKPSVTPIKDGYEFDGWYLGNKEYDFSSSVTKNLILTAHYVYSPVPVSIDLDGSTDEKKNFISPWPIRKDTKKIKLSKPSRPGYEFKGWKDKDGKMVGQEVEIDLSTMTEEEIAALHYEAVWSDAVLYNVTLIKSVEDNKASDIQVLKYTAESESFALPSANHDGYIFLGWMLEGDDLQDPHKSVVISKGSFGDKTYKAIWQVENYNIRYILSGGTVGVNPTTYNINTETFTLKNPVRPGHDFLGWIEEDDDTPSKEFRINKGEFGARTIIAKWSNAIRYGITFTLNGGELNGSTNPTMGFDVDTDSFSIGRPEKQGYDFVGWTGSNGSVPQRDIAINKGSVDNRHYVANWSPKNDTSYKVIHQQEGLDGEYVTVSTDNLKGTTDSTVVPDRMTFEGFTVPEGRELTILPDGSAELTYRYTRNRYMLTLTKDNYLKSVSSTGAVTDQATAASDGYLYGEEVTLSAVPADSEVDSSYTYGGNGTESNNDGHRWKWKHVFSFKQWSDGNTEAQRTITMSSDNLILSANGENSDTLVADEQYKLTVTKGANMQSVTGEGWYNKGATATASGTANANSTESSYTYTNGTTTDDGKGYRYKKTHTYTVNTQKPVMDNAKSVTITATDTTGKSGEQYYHTVNKDSGVSTATASQWVNKGSSVNVTATAKSGYKITGGTGSTGAMNAKKTVNVTSAIDGYTLTWSSALSQYGQYLGSSTSAKSTNGGDKAIVYINTSGQTAYANPYSSGNITIKKGTAVKIRMIAGSSSERGSGIYWYANGTRLEDTHMIGYKSSLLEASYTPNASGTLTNSWDYGSQDHFSWYVDLS